MSKSENCTLDLAWKNTGYKTKALVLRLFFFKQGNFWLEKDSWLLIYEWHKATAICLNREGRQSSSSSFTNRTKKISIDDSICLAINNASQKIDRITHLKNLLIDLFLFGIHTQWCSKLTHVCSGITLGVPSANPKLIDCKIKIFT